MYKGDEIAIQIPGFTIAGRQWGTDKGIPVLALHGWLDNASSFEFLAPLLENTHIVAIDSPGCGHSTPRPEGSIPHFIDEAFHSLQVAEALGWKKFVVLGHSKGGGIAQLISAAAPERVIATVLLEIIGFYTGKGENAAERLRKTVKSIFGEQRPATVFKDLKAAAEGRMLSSPINYESALALAKRGTAEVDGAVIWTFDRRERNIPSVIRFSQEQHDQILEAIESPTCVVLADKGIIPDQDMAKQIAKKIHNVTLQYVSGGHHVHMDDPKPVAKIVNAFLSKVVA